MGLFIDMQEELPLFKEIWKYKLFDNQKLSLVSQSRTKVVQLKILRNETFHPVREDRGNSEGKVKSLKGIMVEGFVSIED